MKLLSRLAAQARTVLAAGITDLLDADAFWFVINCDASYGFSLCHRLGMCVRDYEALLVAADLATLDSSGILRSKYTQWLAFVDSGHFVFRREHIHCDSKKTDLRGHVEGSSTMKKRNKTYHVLRIGQVIDSTKRNLLCQIDRNNRLIQTPPKLKQLRSLQRAFARAATPLIFQAIYQNPVLYEQFMSEEERPTQTLCELVVETERDMETENEQSVSSVTPAKEPSRPSKRIKLGTGLDDAAMVSTLSPNPAYVEGAEPSGSSVEKATNETLLANDIDEKEFPILAMFAKALGDRFWQCLLKHWAIHSTKGQKICYLERLPCTQKAQ